MLPPEISLLAPHQNNTRSPGVPDSPSPSASSNPPQLATSPPSSSTEPASSSNFVSSNPETWLASPSTPNSHMDTAAGGGSCASVCQNGAHCDLLSRKCVCDEQNWVGAACDKCKTYLFSSKVSSTTFPTAVCEGDTEIDCSGNGMCDATVLPHRCICIQHWKGARCDIRMRKDIP